MPNLLRILVHPARLERATRLIVLLGRAFLVIRVCSQLGGFLSIFARSL
jgi:hypothetical protein